MPWTEGDFIPLRPSDLRNVDRHDPGGERIRVRINREGREIVDFVVQYETPSRAAGQGHRAVLRSDGTHGPHYDLYDVFGNKETVLLPNLLSAHETITHTVAFVRRDWRRLRERYHGGL